MPGTDFFKKRTFLKKDVFFLWNLQGSYFQQNTENLLITKEEYLLIIQSSDVGMSSKRTYARSESHVISFSGKKSSVFGIGDKNGSGLVTTLPDSSQEKKMIPMNKMAKKGLRIIIVGCGKVGNTLTEQLVREGHDITLIDKNADKISVSTGLYDAQNPEMHP